MAQWHDAHQKKAKGTDGSMPFCIQRSKWAAYAPLEVACSTRKVLPPLPHTRTIASCPLGTLANAFCTSVGV